MSESCMDGARELKKILPDAAPKERFAALVEAWIPNEMTLGQWLHTHQFAPADLLAATARAPVSETPTAQIIAKSPTWAGTGFWLSVYAELDNLHLTALDTEALLEMNPDAHIMSAEEAVFRQHTQMLAERALCMVIGQPHARRAELALIQVRADQIVQSLVLMLSAVEGVLDATEKQGMQGMRAALEAAGFSTGRRGR